MKVLFIVKCRNHDYEFTDENDTFVNGKKCLGSGLYNSARLVSEMLNHHGHHHNVESHIVQVIDNNDIDREVSQFNPDVVIIEALWVVPEKFDVLRKLHPKVKWIVRLHSEIPFIANEGISLDWSLKYLQIPNVFIGINSSKFLNDFSSLVSATGVKKNKLLYMPNYYALDESQVFEKHCDENEWMNISCFGAIRPLKNQLLQAIATIEYGEKHNKKVKFHINSTRVENNGNNILKNIRTIFDSVNPHKFRLVEHQWLPHHKFLKVTSQMDLGLQVSFSETFNIVTADMVSQKVPVVVSSEITWVSSLFRASTTDSKDIVRKMETALSLGKFGTYLNLNGLKNYNNESVDVWFYELKKL
jgi:hypothetical protein